jgi:hypothetical protein
VKAPSEAELKKGGVKKAEQHRRDMRGIVVKRFEKFAVASRHIHQLLRMLFRSHNTHPCFPCMQEESEGSK